MGRLLARRFAVILGLTLGCNAGSSTNTPQVGPAPAAAEPKLEVQAVRWPAPATIDQRVRAGLPARALATIAQAPVPVLVPPDAALLTHAQVVVEPAFYALSTRDAGVTVSLHATRMAYRHDDIATAHVAATPLRGGRGFVTVNENVRSASWVENGTSYVLDVECTNARDARCQDDAYLLGLVEHLVYVGGSGR